MDNVLLYASVHSPAYKIKERITLDLRNAPLYLAESDYEQDNKYAAANTFDIYYGDGLSSSTLSAITLSVLDTFDVVRC